MLRLRNHLCADDSEVVIPWHTLDDLCKSSLGGPRLARSADRPGELHASRSGNNKHVVHTTLCQENRHRPTRRTFLARANVRPARLCKGKKTPGIAATRSSLMSRQASLYMKPVVQPAGLHPGPSEERVAHRHCDAELGTSLRKQHIR